MIWILAYFLFGHGYSEYAEQHQGATTWQGLKIMAVWPYYLAMSIAAKLPPIQAADQRTDQ